MNNQLARHEMKSKHQRNAWMALAVIFVISLIILGVYQFQVSDPYIQRVLALNGNAAQGHAIFEMNCAGCHGIQGHGRVGPSLVDISKRRSRVSLIRQVISGDTPPMPQFMPSPQEMADLLKYLETL